MVTFEEVRENSDDEEVSTKEGLNYRNQWKCSNMFLKLLDSKKASFKMKTIKVGPNDNINWVWTSANWKYSIE